MFYPNEPAANEDREYSVRRNEPSKLLKIQECCFCIGEFSEEPHLSTFSPQPRSDKTVRGRYSNGAHGGGGWKAEWGRKRLSRAGISPGEAGDPVETPTSMSRTFSVLTVRCSWWRPPEPGPPALCVVQLPPRLYKTRRLRPRCKRVSRFMCGRLASCSFSYNKIASWRNSGVLRKYNNMCRLSRYAIDAT